MKVQQINFASCQQTGFDFASDLHHCWNVFLHLQRELWLCLRHVVIVRWLNGASKMLSKSFPKNTWTWPRRAPHNSPEDSPNRPPKWAPKLPLQTAPPRQGGGHDSWPECGPSLRPANETLETQMVKHWKKKWPQCGQTVGQKAAQVFG